MNEPSLPPPAVYVRHRIMRFRAVVRETGEHFAELCAFSHFSAAAPYVERAGIIALLDDPALTSTQKSALESEFRDAESALAALERDLGRAYREKLRQELTICMDAYAAAVYHARLSNPVSRSSEDPCLREVISVLVRELRNDYPLDDLCRFIHELDDGLSGMQDPRAPAPGYPENNRQLPLAGKIDPISPGYPPVKP